MPLNGSQRVALTRQRLKARLIEQFGAKCRKCGSTVDLEFAHIKPTKLNGRGRGMKERLYDIKRHPSHYMLLCRQDHAEMDSRKPKPQKLSAEDEFRGSCMEDQTDAAGYYG